MVTLLHRTVVDQLRDKEFKAKCIQHLITAIIIGIIFLRTPWNETKSPYYQSDVFNINGAITILVVFFSFAFVYLVIYKFPQMKKLLRRYFKSLIFNLNLGRSNQDIVMKIYFREHYNGLYPIYAIYLAEISSGLPFNLIMPLIFSKRITMTDFFLKLCLVAIVYCMVGFSPYVSSFFSIYFTYLLVSLCASGFGYTISALAPSPQWASSIAPPLITPLFIFCGVLVKLDTLPPYIQWLKYLSWFYYG